MKKCPYKNFEECIGNECAAYIINDKVNNIDVFEEEIIHNEYCGLTGGLFISNKKRQYREDAPFIPFEPEEEVFENE